jgi:hypothetical protein
MIITDNRELQPVFCMAMRHHSRPLTNDQRTLTNRLSRRQTGDFVEYGSRNQRRRWLTRVERIN